MPLLLDTGPFAMILVDSPRLGGATRRRILAAQKVYVSAITFYEIGQKVRFGKWDEMAPHAPGLPEAAAESDIEVLPLGAEVALAAALLDWPHRDPFDRILAALARGLDMPLVSPDRAFDEIGVERVWD